MVPKQAWEQICLSCHLHICHTNFSCPGSRGSWLFV